MFRSKWFFGATILLLSLVSNAAAQQRQLSIEGGLSHIALAYAWPKTPDVSLGVRLGVGPINMESWHNDNTQFTQMIQLDPFYRRHLSPNAEIEIGPNVGIGAADDVKNDCGGMFCGTGFFAGISAGVMVGVKNFKVGPRLYTGWGSSEGNGTRFFVTGTPLILRASFYWK